MKRLLTALQHMTAGNEQIALAIVYRFKLYRTPWILHACSVDGLADVKTHKMIHSAQYGVFMLAGTDPIPETTYPVIRLKELVALAYAFFTESGKITPAPLSALKRVAL